MVEQRNTWLGVLFDPANRDRTVVTLLESQLKGSRPEREIVERRLNDAGPGALTDADLHAMIDSLGDVGAR